MTAHPWIFGLLAMVATTAAQADTDTWPSLREYRGEFLQGVAMPIGGIGTGTVSLGGRGDLRDWELGSRGALGWTPTILPDPTSNAVGPFLMLVAEAAGQPPVSRVLEGPLPPAAPGDWGRDVANPGLPRFDEAIFSTSYPFARVRLRDEAIPLAVELEAFNPLIPTDAERSGIPVAVLRCTLTNSTDAPARAAVAAVLPNFIGADGWEDATGQRRNRFRDTGNLRGILMDAPGAAPDAVTTGTLALTTPAREGVSHQVGWPAGDWNRGLTRFWEDLQGDQQLTAHRRTDVPIGTLAVTTEIPAGATRSVTFLLTWHFPQRRAWDTGVRSDGAPVGNHYATRATDAWAVAEDVAVNLADLRRRTVEFVHAFLGSDLPPAIQEAALFNLSTLRSQTVFRTADGRTHGWEGSGSIHGTRVGGQRQAGWGYGDCLHVWNYDLTTPYLFGALAWEARATELTYGMDDTGGLSTRIGLPLEDFGHQNQEHAADGQLGTLVRVYRDWQLSGDTTTLLRLWPAVRRAMEFVWATWDLDQDGVLERSHGSTLDVEWSGPHPQTATWYLAALRATQEMATAAGNPTFAWRCGELFSNGRTWIEEHLFNGEYYQQQLLSGTSADLQVGPGCFADQLIGCSVARSAGLGRLLDPGHVASALSSVLRYNRVSDWNDRLNVSRAFVRDPHSGLVLVSYPREPVITTLPPYAQESWPGVDYGVATLLLYEGREEGTALIASVRDRYDGRDGNPYDEVEFGHHYARSLAAWGGVLGATGFGYSAVDRHLTLAPREGSIFWSTGWAYGTARHDREAATLGLTVLGGELPLERVTVSGQGSGHLGSAVVLTPGPAVEIPLSP